MKNMKNTSRNLAVFCILVISLLILGLSLLWISPTSSQPKTKSKIPSSVISVKIASQQKIKSNSQSISTHKTSTKTEQPVKPLTQTPAVASPTKKATQPTKKAEQPAKKATHPIKKMTQAKMQTPTKTSNKSKSEEKAQHATNNTKVTPPVTTTQAQSGINKISPTATPAEKSSKKGGMNQALAELIGAIERYKKYPKAAQRAGYTGLVKLNIHISSSGVLVSCHIKESSGYSILDKAALRAATKLLNRKVITTPLSEELNVTLPIMFKLK